MARAYIAGLLLAAVALGWARPLPAAVEEAPPAVPAAAHPTLQPPPSAAPALGALLPLSGRYAPFGEQVRRGLELALALRSAGSPPVRLLLRDAGADPEQNARAVAELASDPTVLAVVGPLTSAAALAAAGQAQQEQLPLLTLSQREGLPGVGDFVFRNSLTVSQMVRTLVDFAVEELGLKSFAVLYPEHKLGREAADLFAREVEKRGGRVVARRSYAESDTDFRRPIRLLQGKNPDVPDAEPPPPPSPLPFAALFIPDDAERVGLILPQLEYFGVTGVQLLGDNGWNSPGLLARADRSAEGAVFVDGFFRDSPSPVVRTFVERFREQYGEEPTFLEAQGFDAAQMLFALLDRDGGTSRDELRLALTRLRGYPGVTGATSFDATGEAQKPLFLLQVQDGAIVHINP